MASPVAAAALVPHLLPGGLPFGEGGGRAAAPQAAPSRPAGDAAAPAAAGAPCDPASPRAEPASASVAERGTDETCPAASNGTPGGNDAAPRPPAAPRTSRPLRCLDERHPPSCTRCGRPGSAAIALTPQRCALELISAQHALSHSCWAAPPDENVADCSLIGDPQKKNGAPVRPGALELRV